MGKDGKAEISAEMSLKHLDISLSFSGTIKPPGLSEMTPGVLIDSSLRD